jgi:MYXO-CTERM domain-containing protein
VSTDLANATMYVQVQPGSTTMRAPKTSDVDGLCDSVGGSCIAEVTGGCSTGSGSGGAAILVVLGLVRRRRRR